MIRFALRLAFFHLPLAAAFLFVISFGTASAAGKRALQPSPSDGLMITEFYYNPPGLDAEREWVELANLSRQSVQLPGFGLGDEERPGGGEGMLRFPEGSEIGPGEAVVVAQTAVGFRTLFGVAPDYEVTDTDTAVPDMIADKEWATGDFALANDGDEILLIDDRANIVDALNYGDQATFFTPSIPLVVSGQSIERVPAVCDMDSAVDWRPISIPTPGELTTVGQCALTPELDNELGLQSRAIGEIQGTDDVSPLLNQIVTFRGLVTGIVEDQNAAGVIYYTIFVQDVPGFEDGDPATSDAVAVFLGRQRPRYDVGDQIAVTGQITEYFGLTEIDDKGLSIAVESHSQTLPAPALFELPQDEGTASAYLEAHESMLMNTRGLLPVLGPTHSGCGFALGWTPDSTRPLRHSGKEEHMAPLLVLNQSDVDCSDLPALKTGDLVAGVAGPLTYHFEQYKVVQQNNDRLQVERTPTTLPHELSIPSPDILRVAALNLDNYLIPSLDQEDAAAERLTVEETEIKKRKTAYTISHTLGCPEVIGVQEVEAEALLLDLAISMTDSCGFTYQVTHQESADGRGIDVALLSDPRRVSVGAVNLRQTCTTLTTGVHDSTVGCSLGEEPLFSRPPLEAALSIDGEPLTILVNHFKSKRGGESETAPRRQAQARHVHGLVRDLLANDPQAAVIVLGDFNDYNLSPVWQQLQEGGVLLDAMQKVPPQERYSYIFDGMSQLVDGILVSPALVHRIEKTTIAHVNADFPNKLALDESPSGLPFHASDHDPVLLIIRAASHSMLVGETATVHPETTDTPAADTQVPAVSAAVQPTAVLEAALDAAPTSPTGEASVPQSANDWSQYVFLVGLAILLLATAVFLSGRRGSR